jgi:glycosyltransferase involved in cell wall biosynthesis
LGVWFSAQPATLRRRLGLGFRLVLTVWETIPFMGTYRAVRGRAQRRAALREADLFLAATERARDSLVMEGVPPERVRVSPPGVDRGRFAAGASVAAPSEHLVLSAGRLVWEKGHQDVLRAVGALARGMIPLAEGTGPPRVLIVGSGPEEARLRRYADELGIGSLVELRRSVPYEEMPAVFARASCMVLASLPTPRWEEQFGMVLAEGMASGLPVIASASGAIPEVVGPTAAIVSPGDWMGLARALSQGPLGRPPGARQMPDPARVDRYSSAVAAERLHAAYGELLGR